MNFTLVAARAAALDCDHIHVQPLSDGQIKLVMERRMSGVREEMLFPGDMDLEVMIAGAVDLGLAGWEANVTSTGVRAFRSNAKPFACERRQRPLFASPHDSDFPPATKARRAA